MKRRFMAFFISLSMILSAVVSIPAKVFAEGVNVPSFTDFGLNDTSSVKATWDKDKQTLTVTGNGKIDINKWEKLAQKFHKDNFKGSGNGWKVNNNFTLKIADNTIQLPDKPNLKNGSGFFEDFNGKIEIAKINTSNLTNLDRMFYNAKNANTDLSDWDVSNVNHMLYTFYRINWKNIDLSKWDTSKVNNMNCMFQGATVENIDLSNFDTSKVTSMEAMFWDSRAKNINVGNFDTSNVTNMKGMFFNITASNIDVSKWNTSKLSNIESMFEKSSVTELDMSNWDTSKITKQSSVIKDANKLEFLKISKFPNKIDLNKFADNYIVEILNDDDETIASTKGPFNKDQGYELIKNKAHRVYMANTPTPKINRIYGNNRYQTAIKSSQNLTNNSLTVFVASGESIIDALTASYVSAISKSPIILTSKALIDENSLKEIKRIKAEQVVIMGGVNVVSENVENQLKAQNLDVSRINGLDRYDTAAEFANIASTTLGLDQKKIFLCSGKTYADALSIASVTAKQKGIILLTDGDTLNEKAKKFMQSDVSVKIIGGNAVISNKLEQEIKSAVANVERIYGNDRFETSLEIYKKYYDKIGVKTVYIANGITMVDALTGTSLAVKDKTALLLTNANNMINPMKSVVKKMKRLRILGGSAVIQNDIWK